MCRGSTCLILEYLLLLPSFPSLVGFIAAITHESNSTPRSHSALTRSRQAHIELSPASHALRPLCMQFPPNLSAKRLGWKSLVDCVLLLPVTPYYGHLLLFANLFSQHGSLTVSPPSHSRSLARSHTESFRPLADALLDAGAIAGCSSAGWQCRTTSTHLIASSLNAGHRLDSLYRMHAQTAGFLKSRSNEELLGYESPAGKISEVLRWARDDSTCRHDRKKNAWRQTSATAPSASCTRTSCLKGKQARE